MGNPTPMASMSNRRLITLAILAYSILWAVGFVFLARIFGDVPAIGLSLIMVFSLYNCLKNAKSLG